MEGVFSDFHFHEPASYSFYPNKENFNISLDTTLAVVNIY